MKLVCTLISEIRHKINKWENKIFPVVLSLLFDTNSPANWIRRGSGNTQFQFLVFNEIVRY